MRQKINFDKNRVLLSEVLPYEIPNSLINFNYKLYQFVKKNHIKVIKSQSDDWFVEWQRSTEEKDKQIEDIKSLVIMMLLGLMGDNFEIEKCKEITKKCKKDMEECKECRGDKKNRKSKENKEKGKINISKRKFSIPLSFNILRYKGNSTSRRTLSVIHPRHQLMIAWLYEKYNGLILYYAGLSPFSIRIPYKISNFTRYKRNEELIKLGEDEDALREVQDPKDYVSFFKYRNYDNLYKFYDSKKFKKYEKKFKNLCILDVSHFFNSIYTHTIDWAIWGKILAKSNINKTKKSFSGYFDQIMRGMNHSETSGIVIGPEFSRVFAEIIMQSIDVSIYQDLLGKSKYQGKDYEICRYVDDYFIFYNSDEDGQTIQETIEEKLEYYKLHLNTEKTKFYAKPIITELTIAKHKIRKLICNELLFTFVDDGETDNDSSARPEKRLGSNLLIDELKSIVYENKLGIENVLNYILYEIDQVCVRSIREYSKRSEQNDSNSEPNKERRKPLNRKEDSSFFNYIRDVIEVAFFFYSLSPSITPSITLSRVVINFINFINSTKNPFEVSNDIKYDLYKFIYDEVKNILRSNPVKDFTPIESLHLLILLKSIDDQVHERSSGIKSFDYKIPEESLVEYLGINKDKKKQKSSNYSYNFNKMNYMSTMVVLWYIGKDKDRRYKKIKPELIKHIRSHIEDCTIDELNNNTEKVLMLIDSLSCPHINMNTRKAILRNYLGKIKGKKKEYVINERYKDIINYIEEHIYFTDWKGQFKLHHVLFYKKRRPVY